MNYESILPVSGRASRLLKAMGNQKRLEILCSLSKGEHSVNELCRLVHLSQSALSQHLAKLRKDSLVKTRRDAQTVFYSLNGRQVPHILEGLRTLYVEGEGVSDAKLREAHHEEPLRRTAP